MTVKLLTCLLILKSVSDAAKIFDKDDVKFRFASAFQDNMVLQRQPEAAVLWGFGAVEASVTVTIGNDTVTTKVVENPKKIGVWKVTLKPQPPGGPHTILASQDNKGVVTKLQLINVLFGDVWICGGQSNMQFTVSMAFNATKEYDDASHYSNIRLMTPAEVQSDTPLDDFKSIEQPWTLPSKESLGGPQAWTYFSAVCWFFGRYLYDELQIPLGLISPNWGGTVIEAWSSPRALEKCGLSQQDKRQNEDDYSLRRDKFNQSDSHRLASALNDNSVLWNGMIHPLLNMTIKGAIWYQGESNAGYHIAQYSCSFPAMIDDWRKSWFEGTGEQTNWQFPFGFVQLSTNNVIDDASYSLIRWHQTGDFGYVPNSKMPNTFMAEAMDLSDFESPYGSIHPRYKQDVGSRLTLGALQVVYSWHVNPQGPFPVNAIRTGDGHVVVTYPNEQQLVVKENGNFEICCDFSTCLLDDPSPSSNWLWAPIVYSDHRSIKLQSQVCISGGGQVALLRYAWTLTPCQYKSCSVYNDIGLPGPPFVIAVTDL